MIEYITGYEGPDGPITAEEFNELWAGYHMPEAEEFEATPENTGYTNDF